MDLLLSSRTFVFEKGKAWFVPYQLGRLDALLQTTGEAPLPEVAEIDSNVIRGVSAEEPGEFHLMLMDLLTQRAYDHLRVSVPVFPWPAMVVLTQDDLERGNSTIAVEPAGLFRLTLIDRATRPVPHQKLSFFGVGVTFSIKADEAGSIIFLGNPLMGGIALPADTGLTVVPL